MVGYVYQFCRLINLRKQVEETMVSIQFLKLIIQFPFIQFSVCGRLLCPYASFGCVGMKSPTTCSYNRKFLQSSSHSSWLMHFKFKHHIQHSPTFSIGSCKTSPSFRISKLLRHVAPPTGASPLRSNLVAGVIKMGEMMIHFAKTWHVSWFLFEMFEMS